MDLSTFSLLQELPDAAEDLAPQMKLDSFTNFPDLPRELCQQIWRCAFPPGRVIRLDTDWYCSCCPKFQNKPTYPTTLWVNKESRTETLLFYRTFEIDEDDNIEDIAQIYPMCFNPCRDMLYFTSYHLLHGYFRVWMKEFVRNQPTAFDQVEELAIDFGVERIGFATCYGWTEELKDELRRTDHEEPAFRGPLRYFPNLTKLILIVTLEKKMSRIDEIECKIELVEHFRRLRVEDSKFKVPEIVISPWNNPGRFEGGPQIDSSAWNKA
jgi:hypothetical protein